MIDYNNLQLFGNSNYIKNILRKWLPLKRAQSNVKNNKQEDSVKSICKKYYKEERVSIVRTNRSVTPRQHDSLIELPQKLNKQLVITKKIPFEKLKFHNENNKKTYERKNAS